MCGVPWGKPSSQIVDASSGDHSTTPAAAMTGTCMSRATIYLRYFDMHHWACPMCLYGTLCWSGGGGVCWWHLMQRLSFWVLALLRLLNFACSLDLVFVGFQLRFTTPVFRNATVRSYLVSTLWSFKNQDINTIDSSKERKCTYPEQTKQTSLKLLSK